jgi:hypothetical protein
MTHERYYCLLSDIRDIHGELFVDLERIEQTFQRQLQQEVVDDFIPETSSANAIGRPPTQDVATVFIDRSGYARGILNDNVGNALSSEMGWWRDDVANDNDGVDRPVTKRVRIDQHMTTVDNELSPHNESISYSDESTNVSRDLNRTRSDSRMDLPVGNNDELDDDSMLDSEEVRFNQTRKGNVDDDSDSEVDDLVVNMMTTVDNNLKENSFVRLNSNRSMKGNDAVLIWDTGAARHVLEFIPQGSSNIKDRKYKG